MSWVPLSLLAPILFGTASLVDDYMSRQPFKNKAFLYVFGGGIFLLIPSIAIYTLHPTARAVPFWDALKMTGMGAVMMTSFISLYIFSIQRSGAAIVVPVLQTIPAFVFLGGYLFLGETVSAGNLAACVAIMLAAVAITWDFKARGLNIGSLALMIAASFGIAGYMLCARFFTETYDPYIILAHVWGGFGGVCLVMMLVMRSWAADLRQMIAWEPKTILSGLAAQAVCQTFGELCLVHALSLAPAAGLVQTISGIQPAYILLFFIVAGYLVPSAYSKVPFDRVLAWKAGCIIILFAGVAAISL
jgi:drug/metabolite transporter (DMT)-like permease